MKILLINNNTRHLRNLHSALAGHEIEVQYYRPGLEFHDAGKDLIVLSGGGGEGLEIDDIVRRGKLWYQDEMDFVLRNKKPMVGICMGLEVICRAYGAKVPKMNELIESYVTISAAGKGKNILNQTKLKQFEAHQWHVPQAPKGFEVLADSEYGIEIIQKDNIIATQFHPEKGGSLGLEDIIQNLKTKTV